MASATHDDAYQITWLIRRVFRAMGKRSNEELAKFELTAADRAVMEFLDPDKALSVPEIADRYSVSRQHVQVTVDRLLNRGMLATRKNPRHKRSVLISLTKQSRSLFRKIRARDGQIVDELFRNISTADIKRTKTTLETLLQELREEVGKK